MNSRSSRLKMCLEAAFLKNIVAGKHLQPTICNVTRKGVHRRFFPGNYGKNFALEQQLNRTSVNGSKWAEGCDLTPPMYMNPPLPF